MDAAALTTDSKVSTTCPDSAQDLVTSHFLFYLDVAAESRCFPDSRYSFLAAGHRAGWRVAGHLVLKQLVSSTRCVNPPCPLNRPTPCGPYMGNVDEPDWDTVHGALQLSEVAAHIVRGSKTILLSPKPPTLRVRFYPLSRRRLWSRLPYRSGKGYYDHISNFRTLCPAYW